jgi:hypothetical protein
MSTRLNVAALVVLSVTQLAAASWSIARYETTLKSGTLFRIRTIPVDPADAFRGRYVAVRPSITILKPVAPETERVLERIQSGERGYVVLTTGADGFASAGQLLEEPPPQGDYLTIDRVWPQWSRDTASGTVPGPVGYNIDFSFDRYYMSEAAAPEAQQRYADATSRNAATRAWLTVRVRNGVGVIEGLFIDDVPIEAIVALSPR